MDYNNNQNIPPQGNGYYGGVNPSFRNPGMAMATASLFLGVASFFTMLSVFLPFLFGGLAILFALLSKGYGKKMLTQAKIGLLSGIGGLCVTVVLCVSSMSMLLKDPDLLVEIGQQYDEAIESIYGQSAEEIYGESFEDIMKQYADLLN
ncbi:MAG: hypothetical protein ACI4SD_01365 [Suilimivivens sp.]